MSETKTTTEKLTQENLDLATQYYQQVLKVHLELFQNFKDFSSFHQAYYEKKKATKVQNEKFIEQIGSEAMKDLDDKIERVNVNFVSKILNKLEDRNVSFDKDWQQQLVKEFKHAKLETEKILASYAKQNELDYHPMDSEYWKADSEKTTIDYSESYGVI